MKKRKTLRHWKLEKRRLFILHSLFQAIPSKINNECVYGASKFLDSFVLLVKRNYSAVGKGCFSEITKELLSSKIIKTLSKFTNWSLRLNESLWINYLPPFSYCFIKAISSFALGGFRNREKKFSWEPKFH